MYIADLELCVYHPGPLDTARWAVPLRAVGWLEHPHPYTRGTVPVDFVARLADMVVQTSSNFPHYSFRGRHQCSICAAEARAGLNDIIWSEVNLIIPGVGEIFAVPGGIGHYLSDHSYRPPASLIQAVFSCPPIGSSEYLEKLRMANAGQVIPIETEAEFDRRLKDMFDSTRRFLTILGTSVVGSSREQIVAAASQVWPGSSLLDSEGSVFLGEPKNSKVLFDQTGIAIEIETVYEW